MKENSQQLQQDIKHDCEMIESSLIAIGCLPLKR